MEYNTEEQNSYSWKRHNKIIQSNCLTLSGMTKSLRRCCPNVSNTGIPGASSTSPGSPFHYFTPLSVKKYILLSSLNLIW